MPLSQIVSASIEDGAVAPVDLSSVAQYYGYKNRLINGGMVFDQRNNGVAVTASTTSAYIADRWSCIASTTVSGTLQYGRGSPSNWGSGTNGLYFSRSAGTYAGTLKTVQPIESNNCTDLAGQSVILSFYSFVGSTWSGGNIVAAIVTSTGTDQTAAQYFAGTATGQSNAGLTTVTPTTSWQRFTLTATIPSNATQVAVFFQNTGWSGTGTANDYVYITGVQLEKGVTATSFDIRDYGRELMMCQRYYWKLPSGRTTIIISNAFTGVASNAWLFVPNPVTMRAAPTVTSSGWEGTVPAGVYGGAEFLSFNSASNGTYLSGNTIVQASAEL